MSNLKRKCVNITIQQKLDILKELDKGTTAKQLALEYNIGSSTVHDIKKNKNKLLNYSRLRSDSMSLCGRDNRKTMKKSPFELLDRALIHWFNNERAQGKAITGPMCASEAKSLFKTIGLPGKFDASSGWLTSFKNRNGIRSVGNSLDCIWTIGVAEPVQEICEEETTLTKNDEGEAHIEYEIMQMECGNGDILENEFTNTQQLAVEGAFHPNEHSFSDDGTTNALKSQAKFHHTNKIEIKKSLQTESGSQISSGKKANDCEIKNLKYLVEKLEVVTNKLSDLGDNYDHFGRYISLLLKGLPPKKVLYLKQKIVSDVLQSVLAHDKGIPEESLSPCHNELDAHQSKTSASKKKFFYGQSKINVNKNTNNTKPSKGDSNVSRSCRKATQKANNPTKISTGTSKNSSFYTLPCSYGNLMPDDRLKASSVNFISDNHPHKSVNNIKSAESTLRPTYFPVVPVHETPHSTETFSADRTNRQFTKHNMCTTSESRPNEEAAPIQYRTNENSRDMTLEESFEFKQEREIDETVTWDESIKVKVESPCQSEELDEILPDCDLIELFNCGICTTECASKDLLVHHFIRSHPGCIPISTKHNYDDISLEPS